jgi:uncharacterized protein YcbK (DUF882 family)
MPRKYGAFGTVGPAAGFRWSEVDCNGGECKLPSDRQSRKRFRKQARALNMLRAVVRIAFRTRHVIISVNSWHRCAAYNRSIGGATQSQHVECRATDIVVFVGRGAGLRRLSPERVAQLAAKVPAFRKGGIGWYDSRHGNFTHVDHRPNGPARWVNG